VKAKDADELAERVSSAIRSRQPIQAYSLLEPILAERTPFRILDRIGKRIGKNSFDMLNPFLDLISEAGAMGGWVIIGSALKIHLNQNLEETFERCRTMIIHADAWYGADILGERVPGPALVTCFKSALKALTSWQQDPNRWVRRSVGVSVHFWAKRSRGSADLVPRAAALLAFLEPMFEEWETDAIKGVGWGLKTLGKHYPDQLADWLEVQINQQQRRHRRLILKKALTYLPERHKARFLKEPSR
jgi:3-methyladenine DNA glycosylase AlkD